jgi:5-(carboxyamino)imidazole ribonucleotide mutase
MLSLSDAALSTRYKAWTSVLSNKIVKANKELSEVKYDFKTN